MTLIRIQKSIYQDTIFIFTEKLLTETGILQFMELGVLNKYSNLSCSRCRTIGGPNSATKCSFPFKQNFDSSSVDFPSCALSQPPYHDECDLLQRAMNWSEKVPKDMIKVVIR